MGSVLTVIELYLVVVALDVLLGWVQPSAEQMPRRVTHGLTEPVQSVLRAAIKPAWTGGLDVSPLLVVAILGVVRVWLLASF